MTETRFLDSIQCHNKTIEHFIFLHENRADLIKAFFGSLKFEEFDGKILSSTLLSNDLYLDVKLYVKPGLAQVTYKSRRASKSKSFPLKSFFIRKTDKTLTQGT